MTEKIPNSVIMPENIG